jgi:CBS domain-containing protein
MRSPYTALRHLVHGAPLCVPPSASVREALRTLDAARSDALVVVDAASRVPLGIVRCATLARLLIEAGDLVPVATIMTGADHAAGRCHSASG